MKIFGVTNPPPISPPPASPAPNAASKPARVFTIDSLWYECAKHGRVSIYTLENGKISADIERNVGKSKLKTSHKSFQTAEKALLHALLEAEEWGLPELESKP